MVGMCRSELQAPEDAARPERWRGRLQIRRLGLGLLVSALLAGALVEDTGAQGRPIRRHLRRPNRAKMSAHGPTTAAITKDGKQAFVGFHLSDRVLRVRLPDLVVDAVADLSEYFPLSCYHIALDASEQKLFVQAGGRRKILVLDTNTLKVVHTIDDIDCNGMFRSRSGEIVTWAGSTLRFIDTATYTVRASDSPFGLLSVAESPSDPTVLYVGTIGADESWIVERFDTASGSWELVASTPAQMSGAWFTQMVVLPDESKVFLGIVRGICPGTTENHYCGWVLEADVAARAGKLIPIDGWSRGNRGL